MTSRAPDERHLPAGEVEGEQPLLSVVIGTRNRAAPLMRAVESLLMCPTPCACEILVVDNGSTDDTRRVVEQLRAAAPTVRYELESRPGVAFARNRGVSVARAPIVAFMDDDQRAAPAWMPIILQTFAAHPDVHFLGGRVLLSPDATLPDWVSADNRGVLSIIDRGDAVAPIDSAHWMCVAGGNMACRRDVFLAAGGFRPYRRTEDRELTVRLLQAGYVGRYIPDMLMYHYVDDARLTPAYFRHWMAVEGRTRACYRFDELFDGDGRIQAEPLKGRRLMGVSLFIYRQLFEAAGRWAGAWVRGNRKRALASELRARYLCHYIIGALSSIHGVMP